MVGRPRARPRLPRGRVDDGPLSAISVGNGAKAGARAVSVHCALSPLPY